MLDIYRNHGDEIFSGSWPGRALLMPKYSRAGFDRVLKREFGDLRMRDLKTPTCITAYEVVSGQTRVFKTAHAPDLYWGHDQLVWKVAAATSAAPTYFGPVQFTEEDAHVDGGVWANNPSMIAITEAVRRFDRDLEEIRLLSVGTVSPRARIKSFGAARRMGWPRGQSQRSHSSKEAPRLATTSKRCISWARLITCASVTDPRLPRRSSSTT